MKTNRIFNSKLLRALSVSLALASVAFLSSCNDDDDPKKEDTPELITKATLTFTPLEEGEPVVATASDPDGEGVADISVDGPLNLAKDKTYRLSITLINGLAAASDPEYNITAEVEEESDEHMFFFSWTGDTFSDPSGNGNIDNRDDAVRYEDEDENGLPIGLKSLWTTASAEASGEFRVILKHQPDLKSATSTSSTGESDLDITFAINVE